MKTSTRSSLLHILATLPRRCFAITIGYAVLAALSHPAAAAPGDLDLSFGGTGKVTTNLSSGDDSGNSVAIQTDGKIVVAGKSYGDFAVARYNADGSLDTSFNTTAS